MINQSDETQNPNDNDVFTDFFNDRCTTKKKQRATRENEPKIKIFP